MVSSVTFPPKNAPELLGTNNNIVHKAEEASPTGEWPLCLSSY